MLHAMAIHVDDMIISAPDEVLERVVSELKSEYIIA